MRRYTTFSAPWRTAVKAELLTDDPTLARTHSPSNPSQVVQALVDTQFKHVMEFYFIEWIEQAEPQELQKVYQTDDTEQAIVRKIAQQNGRDSDV